MDSELASHLRHMMARGRHARNVFLIAVLICAVLALDATFVGSPSVGQMAGVRSCFGPLLLWALTAMAYAFHLLSQSTAGMTEKSECVFAADKVRALHQLAKIRRRLRASSRRAAD